MATKTCEICKTRPAMDRNHPEFVSPDLPYCAPCMHLADDENHHGDNGHDAILVADAEGKKLPVKNWNVKTRAELDTWLVEERKVMDACWVCHPELDESAKAYVVRRGTSRLGMVINVPQRAAGVTKANVLKDKLAKGNYGVPAEEVKIRTVKGRTTLKVWDFTIAWNENGNWDYAGTSYTDDKHQVRKIRNAAEFLRLIAPGTVVPVAA